MISTYNTFTAEGWTTRGWNGQPEKRLSITAFNHDSGHCVQVVLDGTGIARLKRTMTAMDNKAAKMLADDKKRREKEAERKARKKAKT